MRQNMNFDYNGINLSLANSATAVEEFARRNAERMNIIAQANQVKIDRENRMVAGAEASIAQKELLEQQVDFIQKQNELLSENYSKLKEMYDAQVEANKEAKEELIRSRRYNIAMMVISIIAMFAAIASPLVTLLVSK